MAETRVHHINVELPQCGNVTIPYWEVESGQEGPCFLLTAAQHGNEVQGPEVIRRFIAIAGQHLKRGTILAVPFCNLPAVQRRRHHITSGPETAYRDDGGQNMNRTWPGKPDGNDTERRREPSRWTRRLRGNTSSVRVGHRPARGSNHLAGMEAGRRRPEPRQRGGGPELDGRLRLPGRVSSGQ